MRIAVLLYSIICCGTITLAMNQESTITTPLLFENNKTTEETVVIYGVRNTMIGHIRTAQDVYFSSGNCMRETTQFGHAPVFKISYFENKLTFLGLCNVFNLHPQEIDWINQGYWAYVNDRHAQDEYGRKAALLVSNRPFDKPSMIKKFQQWEELVHYKIQRDKDLEEVKKSATRMQQIYDDYHNGSCWTKLFICCCYPKPD